MEIMEVRKKLSPDIENRDCSSTTKKCDVHEATPPIMESTSIAESEPFENGNGSDPSPETFQNICVICVLFHVKMQRNFQHILH